MAFLPLRCCLGVPPLRHPWYRHASHIELVTIPWENHILAGLEIVQVLRPLPKSSFFPPHPTPCLLPGYLLCVEIHHGHHILWGALANPRLGRVSLC